MAFLIPENLASRSDLPRSLQVVARSFRDGLQDSVTVWLDEDDYGHLLVVFDPDHGIAAIDVKAGRGGRKARLRRSGGDGANPNLSQRVKALEEGLAQRPDTSGTPVVGLLAYPSDSPLAASRAANGQPHLNRDDLAVESIAAALLGFFDGQSMPARNIPAVRAVIKPDIVISELAASDSGQLTFREPAMDPAEVVRVLDRQQERVARDLGSGYRVIRGVAGSGKTLVLTFRARFIAENFPNMRVLLACYNVVLSEALKAATSDLPNVDVSTVDKLVVKLAGRPSNPKSDVEWDKKRSEARRIQEERKRLGYDAVLVDEGQDLNDDQLGLLYSALKEGRDSFVIALDGAQSIYRRGTRWNPPGMTARGRTRFLRVNYRNTREILEFAYAFLTDGEADTWDPGKDDDPDMIIPPEATSREGSWPSVMASSDARTEISAVTNRIESLLKSGTIPGDIAVIYANVREFRKPLYAAMRSRGIPYFDIALNSTNKQAAMMHPDEVRSSTIHSIKGLEFSRVFVLGANHIPRVIVESGEWKRLLYVAMTRAMDELYVSVSGSGLAGDRLISLSVHPIHNLEVRRPGVEQSADPHASGDEVNVGNGDQPEPDELAPIVVSKLPEEVEEFAPEAKAEIVEEPSVEVESESPDAEDPELSTPPADELLCWRCDNANQSSEVDNPVVPNECAKCGAPISRRCDVCSRFIDQDQCDRQLLDEGLSLSPHLRKRAMDLHFTVAEIKRILETTPAPAAPGTLIHVAGSGWLTRASTSMSIEMLGR